MSQLDALPIGPALKSTLSFELGDALRNLREKNISYFGELLKPKDSWRLYATFPQNAAFFDLETTGLSPYSDEITVICTYRPAMREFRSFVNGQNLASFPATITCDDLLVGFNSLAFDLKFIAAEFGELLPICPPHIDLRWVLQGRGIRGPMKEIESRYFGLKRPDNLQGFSGLEAVEAWYRYQSSPDSRILDRLVDYCLADVFSMAYMMYELCYREACPHCHIRPNPSSLFARPRPSDWKMRIPRIGEPARGEVATDALDQHGLAGQTEDGTGDSDSAVEEDTGTQREDYSLMTLMALADGKIEVAERTLLDLFAMMMGIPKKLQKELEDNAMVYLDVEGLRGVLARILARGREKARNDLVQLLVFSFSDQDLAEDERRLIVRLAQELQVKREEMESMRTEALQRANELTARLK